MQHHQYSTEWDEDGGYLDFVTDIRDDSYLRFYVGQSTCIGLRIREHIRAILTGNLDTLHYYILQLGNGQRNANFLRLWTHISDISESTEKASFRRGLYRNLLEMLFCFVSEVCQLSLWKPSSVPFRTSPFTA
jgi:hypothetical protein